MNMSIEIFIALGVIAALFAKSSGRVSLADLAQSTVAVIVGLMVTLWVALILGLTTITALIPAGGWLGGVLTAMGPIAFIVGPVLLGFIYGIVFIVMAAVTLTIMEAIKP